MKRWTAKDKPVEAYHRLDLIALPWFKQRLARLRERLRHFPADYEFFVMQTVREMLPCCRRLAGILAPNGTPEAEQVNFGFDLFTYVLQGLCPRCRSARLARLRLRESGRLVTQWARAEGRARTWLTQ